MNDSTPSSPQTLDDAEAAMRRSLGLDRDKLRAATTMRSGQGAGQSHAPGQPRQRHRFRQDGEVPVEIAETSRVPTNGNGHHAAAEQLQASLQRERAAREQVEHALQQAQATIRTLQTQIAHADMAHKEALATEQRARDAAEHALQEMREKLEVAEAAARAASPARRSRQERSRSGITQRDPLTPVEPEPVQWWVPGWHRRAV